ncbi:MAG: preprotein translocase subunit SecE [Parcubacteria group bacterium CG_4_10_14_0_2_um_filter_7_35_8]|nr:MAG: preprotein translocase subunit SecE [Parcubacteria group bacterium CG23_combo_of_CG06-09_8_20_14_all_35_6]PIR58564.1 MAG: preprotein translocase subunit SecE [Parcubacteria group bacterium CG10_big_fil_rev_8_21_14_0_10_35_15]PIZ77284.1 MAG: preprotein translocase subunit SecE [Parcubacteria group bacterium CG_4_10_14_0_2_um_filter_7_35_8]
MNILNILKGVLAESKKINWPTRKEVLRYTLLVIGLSVILAMFLGGVDILFTRFLNRVILQQ